MRWKNKNSLMNCAKPFHRGRPRSYGMNVLLGTPRRRRTAGRWKLLTQAGRGIFGETNRRRSRDMSTTNKKLGLGRLLCGLGLHKITPVLGGDDHWLFGKEHLHDECARCGKVFEIECIDGFDGTDNA